MTSKILVFQTLEHIYISATGRAVPMDPSLGFAQLLGIASYNQKDRTTNDKNKLLKTKIGNAKKEKRDKGKLSANVQKFLQKQEQEEKKKKLEAKQKLENLQELRSDRAKK